MTRAGRVACIVPGCKRTACEEFADGGEIICGKHYRLADVRWRRLLTKVRRKCGKLGSPPHLISLFYRVWDRIKQQAIERGAGI